MLFPVLEQDCAAAYGFVLPASSREWRDYPRSCKSLNIEKFEATRGTNYSITVHMSRPRRFSRRPPGNSGHSVNSVKLQGCPHPKQSGGR